MGRKTSTETYIGFYSSGVSNIVYRWQLLTGSKCPWFLVMPPMGPRNWKKKKKYIDSVNSRTFVKFCLFWIAFSRSALTFIAPIDQLIPAKLSSLKCCCSTNWADQLFAKEDGESRVCNLSIRIYPCSRTHWSSTLGKENSFQCFKIR